jgi:hypothetical protein
MLSFMLLTRFRSDTREFAAFRWADIQEAAAEQLSPPGISKFMIYYEYGLIL